MIENRGGASGMLGAEIIANAQPDGYTLMVSALAKVALNVSLLQKMLCDPVRDFASITPATATPTVLFVHPSVPIKSVGISPRQFPLNPTISKGEVPCRSGIGTVFRSGDGIHKFQSV